jgi:hypothetical protein
MALTLRLLQCLEDTPSIARMLLKFIRTWDILNGAKDHGMKHDMLPRFGGKHSLLDMLLDLEGTWAAYIIDLYEIHKC